MAKREPKLVQSLERGLVALEKAVRGGVKPTDLAAALGVDRSTAYRLLYTLKEKGYLSQNPSTHEFVPNPGKFFALCSELAGPMNWAVDAAGFLRVLRDRTGETANLGVLQDHEVVYVAKDPAQEALIVDHSLGARRPLHCSALGKAILAYLPIDQAERLIGEIRLTFNTSRSITDPQVLKRHLETVRARGYAIDDEETFDGVRCVAAPIFDHRRQVIASMGISGPSTRMTLDKLSMLAEIVVEVAGQASAALGAQEPSPDGHDVTE